MMKTKRGLEIATIVAVMCVIPSEGTAQSNPILTVTAGVQDFDLSGTGTAAAAEIHYARPASGLLSIESGFGISRPDQQIGETWFWTPEVQLQASKRSGRFRPFVGVGAGGALDFRDEQFGGSDWSMTTSGTVGVRTPVGSTGGVQLEGRVRLIGTGFNGTTSGLTLGWYQRMW